MPPKFENSIKIFFFPYGWFYYFKNLICLSDRYQSPKSTKQKGYASPKFLILGTNFEAFFFSIVTQLRKPALLINIFPCLMLVCFQIAHHKLLQHWGQHFAGCTISPTAFRYSEIFETRPKCFETTTSGITQTSDAAKVEANMKTTVQYLSEKIFQRLKRNLFINCPAPLPNKLLSITSSRTHANISMHELIKHMSSKCKKSGEITGLSY